MRWTSRHFSWRTVGASACSRIGVMRVTMAGFSSKCMRAPATTLIRFWARTITRLIAIISMLTWGCGERVARERLRRHAQVLQDDRACPAQVVIHVALLFDHGMRLQRQRRLVGQV